MWQDPAFRAMDFDGKGLYCYLLTSTVSNAAGYYRLTKAQLRVDLCAEDDESISGFLEEDNARITEKILPMLYGENKLWEYDQQTKQVLVPNYLKYNKIAGPKQLPTLISAVNSLSLSPLHVLFFREASRHLRSMDFLDMWSGVRQEAKDYTLQKCQEILASPSDYGSRYKAAAEIVQEATDSPLY